MPQTKRDKRNGDKGFVRSSHRDIDKGTLPGVPYFGARNSIFLPVVSARRIER